MLQDTIKAKLSELNVTGDLDMIAAAIYGLTTQESIIPSIIGRINVTKDSVLLDVSTDIVVGRLILKLDRMKNISVLDGQQVLIRFIR